MKQYATIAPEQSGAFSSLFLRYIKQDSILKPLFQYEMSNKGILEFAHEQTYAHLDRKALVNELLLQNQKTVYFSGEQKKNIEALVHDNTYTITTGHQLCLFTGPLYFIYKIITVINQAEALNQLQKDKTFVPVYWMATEDHDFDEINHLHIGNQTIRWKRESAGAVGNLDMQGIDLVIAELKKLLGVSSVAKQWIAAIESCYLGAPDLATATRQLVNFLFAEYGVIVIDANTVFFKSQFKSVLEQDVFENKTATAYTATQSYFKNNDLEAQVLVRDINCFYLDKNIRARIEKQGDVFKVVDTDLQFTNNEMQTLFQNELHKISPNVILRPLYQQTILPNAAYIGGPSENDYWLQLIAIFKQYKVAFPVLLPRQFALLADEKSLQTLASLNLNIQDILVKDDELPKVYLAKSGKAFSLIQESKALMDNYNQVVQKMKAVDITLDASSRAEMKRLENGLEKLTKKANRAIKRKEEVVIKRLLKIKNFVMPAGSLQERHDNIMTHDMGEIHEAIRGLKLHLNSLAGEINIIQL
jgi:bacillithiol synthase